MQGNGQTGPALSRSAPLEAAKDPAGQTEPADGLAAGASSQIARLRAELRSARRELDRRDARLEELQGRVTTLYERLEEAAAELARLRAEPARLRPEPSRPEGQSLPLDTAQRTSGPSVVPATEPSTSPRRLTVAAVMDEMSRACFEPDCDLVTFGSEDWRPTLEERQPDLLLVESAWAGNGGAWQFGVASYTHPDHAGLPRLKAIVAWCRERGIPTAFWNKEDPVHFERFKEAAALFDHVFTTDSNCVPRYEALESERTRSVHPLPFAAQPLIHNPIALSTPRSIAPCFAGTYYRNRHADRQGSLEALLDAARPFGLVIFDRRFGFEGDSYGFPERFRPHVAGGLSYAQMLAEYKRHEVFLNVNSVIDSPTMFSRRVFELAACGTAVISTESPGVQDIFGGLVPIVEGEEAATEALVRLLEGDEHRTEQTSGARRLVLTEHTYRHRLSTIAKAVGLDYSAGTGEISAAMVLGTDDERSEVSSLVAAIARQSAPPAELLLSVEARAPAEGSLEGLSSALPDTSVKLCRRPAGAGRSEAYRDLAVQGASPWIAVLHPGHHYGTHHLADLACCTEFAAAPVIGVPPDGASPGQKLAAIRPHTFVEAVHPHSVLVRRELLAKRGWADTMPAALEASSALARENIRMYGIDRAQFGADSPTRA